jgi:hypothetical protein
MFVSKLLVTQCSFIPRRVVTVCDQSNRNTYQRLEDKSAGKTTLTQWMTTAMNEAKVAGPA